MGGTREYQDRKWAARGSEDLRPPEAGSRAGVTLDRLSRITNPGLIVDLGCGDGALILRLRTPCVGIDLSRIALGRIREGTPRICADLDAPRLPLRDQCSGVCTILDALPYVVSPRKLMGEIARILRRGGWLLASVPNARQIPRSLGLIAGRVILPSPEERAYDGGQRHLFTDLSMRDLLEEAGFELAGLTGLLPVPGGSPLRRVASRLVTSGAGRAFLAPGLLAIGRKR
jgi:SAM-dependent methyltransferase